MLLPGVHRSSLRSLSWTQRTRSSASSLAQHPGWVTAGSSGQQQQQQQQHSPIVCYGHVGFMRLAACFVSQTHSMYWQQASVCQAVFPTALPARCPDCCVSVYLCALCFCSVFAQTYKNWVFVSVVKGGSAANTLVKAMDSAWGRQLYSGTLIRNIGASCYKVRTDTLAGTATEANSSS